MTTKSTRLVGGAMVVAGLLGASTTSAAADPPGETFELTCGATTYDIVVAGNGHWTPAHDTDGTAMFIPTRFGDFHGTVLDDEGNVVDEFTDEADDSKGQSAKNKGNIVECTFSFSEVSDGSDPEFPEGFTFIGVGEVSGFTTPPS